MFRSTLQHRLLTKIEERTFYRPKAFIIKWLYLGDRKLLLVGTFKNDTERNVIYTNLFPRGHNMIRDTNNLNYCYPTFMSFN